MKKFLLGILVGLIVAGMTVVVLFFAMVRFTSRTPSMPSQAVLQLRLGGDLPEIPPVEVPFPFLEDRSSPTVYEVWASLRAAASDPRVKAVWLEPHSPGAGWAKMDEIRSGLDAVRKAGKPVYAWLESPSTRDYYLALGADRIFMSPEDMLDLKGLRAEAMYFKGTLDKLGVKMEVEHAGKYKDAGDMFTQTAMTPETREVMNSLLDRLFGRLTEAIGTARKMQPAAVRALIDEGPFLATQAKQKGLVDALAYRDQVEKELRDKLKVSELRRLGPRDYLQKAGAPPGAGRRARFALLSAQGDIVRAGVEGLFGEQNFISPPSMRRQIQLIANDAEIRGVLLRVDSPGGDAIASDEILHDLKELSKKKPLVISMSDVAASGGYYISMTGDPVVAWPGTLTGSIGVIYGKPYLKGLYDKLGITKDILQRGRFADIDTDYRPMTPAARQKLMEGIQSIYDGFLARVAEGRRMKTTEVHTVAQGRVWLGSQAQEARLVDEMGGFDKAVELLRKKAGLEPGEPVRLVPYPRRRTLIETLLQRQTELLAPEDAEARLAKLVLGQPGIAPWLTGGYLRVMPYRIDIH